MRVAGGLLVQNEEFPEFSEGEVTLHVLLLVHHAAAQGFLVGLSLQDLLLNGPSLSAREHTGQTWTHPEASSFIESITSQHMT